MTGFSTRLPDADERVGECVGLEVNGGVAG
jgi:hypothetical protein